MGNKKRQGGRFEVNLVEEGENARGGEQELSVWQENINTSGEHWFEVEIELWKRKRELKKLREYERVKTQELLSDFPHLKVGGLLPDPFPEREGGSDYRTVRVVSSSVPQESRERTACDKT